VNMTPFYILVSIICIWGMINSPRHPGTYHFTKITLPGEYIIYEDHRIPPGEITSMIVDDGKIFLYYDNYAIVNVYTTEGDFQYGIQVYTLKNGRGDFSYIDQKLYIFSKASIVYVIDGMDVVKIVDFASERVRYKNYEEKYRTGEKNTVYEGVTYRLLKEQDQVAKQDSNGNTHIVLDLTQ